MKPKRVLHSGIVALLLMVALMACSRGASPVAGGESQAAEHTPAGESSLRERGRVGWKEFCQTEIGCTLYYPENAHFEQGANKYGVHTMRIQFDLPEAEGYQGMVIRSLPLNEEGELDDVLNQLHQSNTESISFEEWKGNLEEVTIGNMPAWRTFCAVEGGDFSVIIPHGRRVYVATPTHSQASVCSDPATVELFFEVLETLTLE